jgi:hypothetical protein
MLFSDTRWIDTILPARATERNPAKEPLPAGADVVADWVDRTATSDGIEIERRICVYPRVLRPGDRSCSEREFAT